MISKIDGNLYIGNASDAQDVSALNEHGIKACLNVAFDLDISLPNVSWRDIQRAKAGLIDGPGNNVEQMLGAYYTLLGLIGQHENIMIHCHEGKSRSVTIAAMYCAVRDNISFNDAVQIIKDIRPIASPKEALVSLAQAALEML